MGFEKPPRFGKNSISPFLRRAEKYRIVRIVPKTKAFHMDKAVKTSKTG